MVVVGPLTDKMLELPDVPLARWNDRLRLRLWLWLGLGAEVGLGIQFAFGFGRTRRRFLQRRRPLARIARALRALTASSGSGFDSDVG